MAQSRFSLSSTLASLESDSASVAEEEMAMANAFGVSVLVDLYHLMVRSEFDVPVLEADAGISEYPYGPGLHLLSVIRVKLEIAISF